jgi:hypothetical protein
MYISQCILPCGIDVSAVQDLYTAHRIHKHQGKKIPGKWHFNAHTNKLYGPPVEVALVLELQ